MVGGESRNVRGPFTVTRFEASENPHRGPTSSGSATSSKNTNLNRLTSFIVRNAPNSPPPWGNCVVASPAMTITSSENTGDVIVENAFTILVTQRSDTVKPGTQDATCRHWRTLSRDRSRSTARLQLRPVCEPMQNYSPAEPSGMLIRSVSRVSAHASNRIGRQLSPPCRSM